MTRTEVADGWEVARTTALGRTTRYRTEQFLTDARHRAVAFADGTQSDLQIGTDGSRVVTPPDGMVGNLAQGPDPCSDMQAPLTSTLTVTTPGGLASSLTHSRTVTLADPNNPFVLATQTDTSTLDGRTYTSTFDAATKTLTSHTPAGRQTVTTLDAHGRVVQQQVAGLTPLQFAYDDRGRLSLLAQGSRESTLTYNAQGYLESILAPLSRTTRFEYDAAGRVITQTLPDTREIHFSYDANGNLTGVTPPGRPEHGFAYTPVDLQEVNTPPEVGAGNNITQYEYDQDRHLTLITRPDGATIDPDYDSAGRLSTLTLPTEQRSYTYSSTTGKLSFITSTSPTTSALSYSYDGSVLTGTTWARPVSGSVSRTYDTNFRLSTQQVNGSNAVTFTYDDDDLLTGAGALTLSRNPQNGLLTSTTLGNVTDTLGYNPFGEPASYHAAYSGNPLFDVHYTRDDLGCITQKTETIGGVTDPYTYPYDLAGRLTEVQKNSTFTSTYLHDVNSKWLTKTTPGGTVSGTYAAQDRLLSSGSAPSSKKRPPGWWPPLLCAFLQGEKNALH